MLELLDLKNITSVQNIGTGSGGKVKRIFINGKKYACKVFLGALSLQEVSILFNYSHPHLIPGYLVFTKQELESLCKEMVIPIFGSNKRDQYAVIEMLAQDNILALKSNIKNNFFDIIEQISSALDFLAQHNIYYADVKPDNILYTRIDSVYHFYLADYGICYRKRYFNLGCQKIKNIKGTAPFIAPEILQKKVYANSSVWALGLSMVTLLTGKEYEHTWTRPIYDPQEDISTDILLKKNLEVQKFIQTVSADDKVLQLLNRMLDSNPETRIRLSQLHDNTIKGTLNNPQRVFHKNNYSKFLNLIENVTLEEKCIAIDLYLLKKWDIEDLFKILRIAKSMIWEASLEDGDLQILRKINYLIVYPLLLAKGPTEYLIQHKINHLEEFISQYNEGFPEWNEIEIYLD